MQVILVLCLTDFGLLVNFKKRAKIIGDRSLSKRDFSRVTEPIEIIWRNISTNHQNLPVKLMEQNS